MNKEWQSIAGVSAGIATFIVLDQTSNFALWFIVSCACVLNYIGGVHNGKN